MQRKKIYKEFITICLDDPSEDMIKFIKNIQIKYTNWLKDILQVGIDNGKLKPEALQFVSGLFAMGEAVLLYSNLDNYNNKDIIQSHVNSLLKLIQIGECTNE